MDNVIFLWATSGKTSSQLKFLECPISFWMQYSSKLASKKNKRYPKAKTKQNKKPRKVTHFASAEYVD